ncbi:hypothetical protein ACFL0C_02165 [Patescibacteria group bacterium]
MSEKNVMVVVVDDNRNMREGVKMLVGQAKIPVWTLAPYQVQYFTEAVGVPKVVFLVGASNDGPKVIKELKAKFPHAKFIGWGVTVEPPLEKALLDAGADKVLEKFIHADRLLEEIRSLLN